MLPFKGLGRRSHLLVACTGLILAACSPAAAPDRENPSVVLIVIDTLRADHLGTYGYERPTSPQLDAWARSGRVFENAQSTSPWTLPSIASMLTGRLPSRHGATATISKQHGVRCFGVDSRLPTLARVLKRAGYRTGAVVNNPFLDPEVGLSRGFDTYDHEPGSNRETRRADVMVSRALDWLDGEGGEGEAPFFLLLHLFDPHAKYDAPEPQRGSFTEAFDSELSLPMGSILAIRSGELALDDEDRGFIGAAYDEEIAFVDQELERFRRGLEERGLLNDTLVILTADHGEELFDHGGFEHGHSMYQELLHVPLIVWGPGVQPGREPRPVGVSDVAATVLEFADLAPFPGSASDSLWPMLRGVAPDEPRLFTSESILHGAPLTAALEWPLKAVVDPESGQVSLFDLAADPGETVDLAPSRPDDARRLAAALAQALARAEGERSGATEVEMNADAADRLRAIGYAR